MSKILALDFGLKRTGLAISDDAQMFAFGLETTDTRVLMVRLKELVVKESIATLVLGLPKRIDNSDSHITQNVILLKEAIEKEISGVNVVFHDERFTSKMASQALHTAGANRKQRQEKGLIDMVSATIILQSYLQSVNR